MAPVVKAWASANREVQFTVAAPALLEPLFRCEEGNINLLGVSKKQSVKEIFHQLRSVNADVVADMHKVNRVGWALMLLWLYEIVHLHLSFRIYPLHKGRLTRFLMIHHLRRQPRRHQYERYADVFRRMGLTPPTDAAVDNIPLTVVNHQMPPVVGIAPFSQHPTKVWPLDNIRLLVELLTTKGYKTILFGSKEEAPILDKIASRHPEVTSVAGRFSFEQELDLIRNLSLMVSMDSANMHFASCMGIPVISIWGATHPDMGFYGYRQAHANALYANLPCQPCSAYGERPCRYGDYRCLQAITPQQVMETIDSLIVK